MVGVDSGEGATAQTIISHGGKLEELANIGVVSGVFSTGRDGAPSHKGSRGSEVNGEMTKIRNS